MASPKGSVRVKWVRDDREDRHDEDDRNDGTDGDADEVAIVALARRDPRAFAPLYDRYYEPIFGFCLRRLHEREAAADATGQTFARALAGLPSFRGGSFPGWLFAIARNVVIDTVRRYRPTLDLAAAGTVPDGGTPPDEQVIRDEQRARLLAAIARLTPDQRGVVELRLAGLSGREVADALGMTLGAAQSCQFRAYRSLRRFLRDDPLFGELE